MNTRWENDKLIVESDYEWPSTHHETNVLRKVDLGHPESVYFVAADGQCYGLINETKGTCIALVESGLRETGARAVYVTFALRNRTASTVKRWIEKWGKRTGGQVDRFDSSVRVFT